MCSSAVEGDGCDDPAVPTEPGGARGEETLLVGPHHPLYKQQGKQEVRHSPAGAILSTDSWLLGIKYSFPLQN